MLLATPVDESHFIVTVLACRVCGQRFLSVFTETIDWADGDDPQHRVVMPISAAETARLLEASSSLTESDLNALPGRTALMVDRPKGAPLTATWGVGLTVRHHD